MTEKPNTTPLPNDNAKPSPPQTEAELKAWLDKKIPLPPGHISLLTRLPPIPTAAWAKLWAELLDAVWHEKFGFEYPDAPPGFMATEQALLAVVDFLMNFDGLMKDSAVIPLGRLAAALRGLDEGQRPALLAHRQSPKGGRPGTDRRQSAVIGFAARCLDELIQSGLGADAAARKVLDAIRAGGAVGAANMTVPKIKNWRARCREGDPGSKRGAISREAWRHFNEPLPSGMGETAAERADKLLFILRTAGARGMAERLSQQPLVFSRPEQR